MTIKANGHFVDCDGATGDGGDWESTRSGSRTAESKLTYISEDGAIWGIPIDYKNYTTLTLDTDGTARYVGGDTFAIPCLGHPFSEGDVIWITGGDGGAFSHNGEHTLISGTSATELHYEVELASYWPLETFDGTETVVQYIVLTVGFGRMAQASNGDMYYGHTYSGGQCVTKIETDGTIDTTFISPTTAFTSGKTVTGLAITDDSSYLYVCTDNKRLWKFDLSDGSEVWSVSTGATIGSNLDVDSDDNVYVANTGTAGSGTWYTCGRFAAANGAETDMTDMVGIRDVHVDNDMSYSSDSGVVIVGGYNFQLYTPIGLYNLAIRDLDNTGGTQIALGGTYTVGSIYNTYIICSECITTYGDYIYVLCNGRIYKLDSDLTSAIPSIAAPTYAVGLFIDPEGQLVVVCQDWSAVPQDEIFLFYDTDLNYLDTIGGFYTGMLDTWDADTGGTYIQGNVVFYYGDPSYTSATIDWSVTQDRTVAYPIGYGHLEGETVQVLGDGIYLGTETVVDGNIALDDNTTVNHVGLQYTSKLQPMKIDGESKVKRIRHLIPDVFESVGGDYGEDIDDLYTMSLRDTNDPMDIDGDLYTGYVELPFKGSYNRQGDIWITQDEPLPMIVLALGVKMSVERK